MPDSHEDQSDRASTEAAPEQPAGENSRSDLAYWCLLVAILLVGAGLRLWACFTEFWFDEIWSLKLAGRMESLGDIFFKLRIDNNHFLNTLTMYVLGDRDDWFVYRIPPLMAGIATTGVAALIGRRRGRTEAVMVALVTSLSYVLIHYSSEARGYAGLSLAIVVSFYAMERYLSEPRTRDAVLFTLFATLGMLSHLTFLHAYVGLVVWSVVRWWRDRIGIGRIAARFAFCHLLPSGVTLFLYFAFVRHLEIGGGPEYQLSDVLMRTAALTLGAQVTGSSPMIASVVAAGTFVLGLACCYADRNGSWLFFLTSILVMPALLLTFMTPDVLFVRYFLASITSFLLLLGLTLPRLIRSGQVGRVIAYPTLVLFLVGNVRHTSELLYDGRGQYRQMIQDMAERTTGPLVTVASGQDFRNRMVIDFYRHDVADKRIVYVPSERAQDIAPMWLVLNYLSRWDQMDPQLIGPRGDRYILEQTYPSGHLSGWNLALYRKTAAEEADSTKRPE